MHQAPDTGVSCQQSTRTQPVSLLLPHGLSGGALAHIPAEDEDGNGMSTGEEGWKAEYTEWWFEFLRERGGKGVSKDTWLMVRVD